eukprot:gnl/TRDRNA2_/TRDRNA2_135082_c0_seq1.p1 gnl/TRDRNA2_/TRDRNA2_135082_c0~~gnl/TRDRNA2_/TRDRNA2_135082_c0_seq1.p1  ORF type:complete len:687 (-),score=126.29 gnl/TRDRNA2_/TRDRNA2_135082_c0_seq1:50-2110(-)
MVQYQYRDTSEGPVIVAAEITGPVPKKAAEVTAFLGHDQCIRNPTAKGIGNDPLSKHMRTCTIQIFGSSESITVPVFASTRVKEVTNLLGFKLGIDGDQLTLVHKQGCSYIVQKLHEEIRSKVVVKGIRSFKRERTHWPHPMVIIGAGHLGLKTAMKYLDDKNTNFVMFDRMGRVGGTSWIQQANTTSRLQTEWGVYHLHYHEDNPALPCPHFSMDQPWPSRDNILDHFNQIAVDYGVVPYVRFHTNVSEMEIVKGETRWGMLASNYDWGQQYQFTVKKTDPASGDTDESIFMGSAVQFYPGNLTNPKRSEYKGEETFRGSIVYGISNAFDYNEVRGKTVAIIGSGAFAVENVRTCVEFSVGHIYMICRRKTIAMPRVVSWAINQSKNYLSAALTLHASKPMYDLIGVDVWDYYAVQANAARTQCQIRQKARFGIGDVYFLAYAWGKLEHIVDDIKRVNENTVTLISGRKLENVTSMLKLLGFTGEWSNDTLLKVKELTGFWVNEDPRRFLLAEPIYVDASNFGGTSFSPGALMWSDMCTQVVNFPVDWQRIVDGGLPRHKADPENHRPAYVIDARHGSLTAVLVNGVVPDLVERGMATGLLSFQRMWEVHPMKKFLECAQAEWNRYVKMWQEEENCPEKTCPYPYTEEWIVKHILEEEEMEIQKLTEKQNEMARRDREAFEAANS